MADAPAPLPVTAEPAMPGDPDVARIETAIADYNRDRKKVALRSRLTAGAGVAVVVLVAIFALGFTDEAKKPTQFVLLVIGLGVVIAFAVWRWLTKPIRTFQHDLKGRVLPVAFGFAGEVWHSHGSGTSGGLARLRDEKLIAFDHAETDDEFHGRSGDLDFELHEAKLVRGSGKHRSTVFSGLVFVFRREASFPGVFVAGRRTNAVDRFIRDLFGARLAVVGGEVPGLDGDYEFLSDNTAEARRLMDESLGRALAWLSGNWLHGLPRIALAGHDCYLLLPTEGQWFELPPIDMEVGYAAHVEPMVRDFAMLLALARLMRQV